jgi:hypothetical protein
VTGGNQREHALLNGGTPDAIDVATTRRSDEPPDVGVR